MFQSMRFYIERGGRPYNYLDDRTILNQQRDQHLEEEEAKDKAAKQKAKGEQEDKKENHQKMLEDLADKRLVEVRDHMKALKECDKLFMRQFLMKYIIPVLTEGMIDVCKVGPLDPVDYLAEYIFKRSHESTQQGN